MHKLSRCDYLSLYPDASMISLSSAIKKGKAVSEATKLKPRVVSDETRQKLSKAGKIRHHTERSHDEQAYLTKKRRLAAQARAAKGDNYKHSEATREKMKESSPHLKRPMSDETKRKLSELRIGRKFAPHSPETLAKMRAAWERRRADKETYAAYIQLLSDRSSTPERIAAMRDRTARLIKSGNHNGKSSNTKPERMMKIYLKEHGIDYEHQYILHTERGSWTFDFYLPEMNMLVETDSQYYHTKNFEVANRDRMKEQLALEQGYTVARISDKDWNPSVIFRNPDEIMAASTALRGRHLAMITARLLN